MRRKKREVNSWDTETTGLRPYHGDRMFAFCIGDESGNVYTERVQPGERSIMLQDWLWDTSIEKTAHNLKFDYSMLVMDSYDIPDTTIWHDTMVQAQMVRNLSREVSLDGLCWELCGYSRELDLEINRLGRAYGGYQNIPPYLMRKYQIADGERTMLLHQTFMPLIEADPAMYRDYRNEIDLILVTQKMEQHGIMLDLPGIEETLAHCEREIERATDDLDRITGGDDYYNMGSGDDVARLLFSRFSLPVLTFTKTGKPCVDKNVLSELREKHNHPVLDIIQRYRSYMKGHSIISGYKELADKDGIVHPSIRTNGAQATGRESCDNPNLQNVAKPDNQKNPYIVSARGCFRARPGRVLCDVDQSGIELRLIIEAAKSDKMMNLMRSGNHPHIVACKLFYQDAFKSKKENKDLYSAGKNGHFCICYGGGPGNFSTTVGLLESVGERAYNRYVAEFPEIAHLANSGASRAKETGHITTGFGRVLQLPFGKHYAWLNYYIQGTAAGIIKRGQVRVDSYLRNRWPGQAFMFLTVHDSIMFEFDEDVFYKNQQEIYTDISRLMTDIKEVNVPLEVEWKVSHKNWDLATDFVPEVIHEA